MLLFLTGAIKTIRKTCSQTNFLISFPRILKPGHFHKKINLWRKQWSCKNRNSSSKCRVSRCNIHQIIRIPPT